MNMTIEDFSTEVISYAPNFAALTKKERKELDEQFRVYKSDLGKKLEAYWLQYENSEFNKLKAMSRNGLRYIAQHFPFMFRVPPKLPQTREYVDFLDQAGLHRVDSAMFVPTSFRILDDEEDLEVDYVWDEDIQDCYYIEPFTYDITVVAFYYEQHATAFKLMFSDTWVELITKTGFFAPE